MIITETSFMNQITATANGMQNAIIRYLPKKSIIAISASSEEYHTISQVRRKFLSSTDNR